MQMISAMTKFLRDKLKHCAKRVMFLLGYQPLVKVPVLKAIEAANKNNVFTIGFTKSGDNTLSKIAH